MGAGRFYHREIRGRMPDSVKRASDAVIKGGARLTKRLRNRREIEARGESFKRGLRKKLRF